MMNGYAPGWQWQQQQQHPGYTPMMMNPYLPQQQQQPRPFGYAGQRIPPINYFSQSGANSRNGSVDGHGGGGEHSMSTLARPQPPPQPQEELRLDDGARSNDVDTTEPTLQRRLSSRRLLRRKVSFSGVQMSAEDRALQAEIDRLKREEAERQQQQQQQQGYYPTQSNSYAPATTGYSNGPSSSVNVSSYGYMQQSLPQSPQPQQYGSVSSGYGNYGGSVGYSSQLPPPLQPTLSQPQPPPEPELPAQQYNSFQNNGGYYGGQAPFLGPNSYYQNGGNGYGGGMMSQQQMLYMQQRQQPMMMMMRRF